jgi:hypothetical protein
VLNAKAAYESAAAGCETGVRDAMDVCRASAELCRVEQEYPFTDKVRAQALHVTRLLRMEGLANHLLRRGEFISEAGRQEFQEKYEEIVKLRGEAQDKLDELQK